jgi:hypothetical protein
MPETICPGTSKLACWRVQLSTASEVGCRGAGTATVSIEASLLVGDISDPPAKMVLSTASTEGLVGADNISQPPAQMVLFLLAVAYIDRQQGSLLLAAFICTRQHSEAENSLKLIQVTNISTCMDSNK